MVRHDVCNKEDKIDLDKCSMPELLDGLREALESRDWACAGKVAEALASRAGEIGLDEGKTALDRLRRARQFHTLQVLADAMILAGRVDTTVRLRHVQAVLGQGDVTASIALLAFTVDKIRPEGSDLYDIYGLNGEALKQASLASHAPQIAGQLLVDAVERYNAAASKATQAHDEHALLCNYANIIALLARASRKGYALDMIKAPPYPDLARQALNRIEQLDARGKSVAADFAAAIEACFAIGDYDKAARWVRRLTHHADDNALEIGTVVSQLVHVWEIREDSTEGRLLLPALKASLLQVEGGHVALDGAAVASTARTLGQADYEKVFGAESFVPFQWYLDGVERCRLIARFETKYGEGMGSGLLVRGERIDPRLAGRWLAMTNAHVLSDRDEVRLALRPTEAFVTFQGHEGADRGPFAVTEVLWTSPPQELDVTIAAVAQVPQNLPEVAISEVPPRRFERERIYAIGHPLGGGLSLSLHDNLLIDFVEPRIHYRTPTEPGSSGSPLFDSQWNLIGLHHAGSSSLRRLRGEGFYQANEGIWMHSILQEARRHWDRLAAAPDEAH
jgi:S1-C subfamily serine protease